MTKIEQALFWLAAACALGLLVLALAGCAPKEPVKIATPVACVKSADIPSEPAKVGGTLTGVADQDAAILAVLALDLRDWGGKLRALLRGCE